MVVPASLRFFRCAVDLEGVRDHISGLPFMWTSYDKSQVVQLYREVRIGAPDQFLDVHRDDIGICIWERPQNTDITGWCHHILSCCSVDFDGVVSVAPTTLSNAVAKILAPFPSIYAQSAVSQDLEFLLGMFAQITAARSVRVRFGVVRSDECRKFHVDAVKVRLFCTYIGPGTEWIPDEDLVWEKLGQNDCCVDDYNAAILKPGGCVQRLAPFAVALAKGACWPGSSRGGVIHRSPPLEHLGLSRVRLILEEHSTD